MPGCCLFAALLFFGPRMVLVGAYLMSDWYSAFDSKVVALLGFLFLPWTSLAFMYTHFQHGGDISGGYAVLLFFALLVDVGTFGGGDQARKRARDGG